MNGGPRSSVTSKGAALRWVVTLAFVFATIVAHASLVRALADRAHSAAMLTAPSDQTMMLGLLLVGTRLALYVVWPALLSAALAWRLGAAVVARAARRTERGATTRQS